MAVRLLSLFQISAFPPDLSRAGFPAFHGGRLLQVLRLLRALRTGLAVWPLRLQGTFSNSKFLFAGTKAFS